MTRIFNYCWSRLSMRHRLQLVDRQLLDYIEKAKQRTIDWTRMENFAKKPKFSKIIAGAKVDAYAVQLKRSTVFLHVCGTAICRVLSALLRDNMLMRAFSLRIVTCIIDMLTHAHSKLAAGLFHFGKSRHFSVFFFSCLLYRYGSSSLKQIPTTNGNFIKNKSKQLQVFTITNKRKRCCQISVPVYLQFLGLNNTGKQYKYLLGYRPWSPQYVFIFTATILTPFHLANICTVLNIEVCFTITPLRMC